MTTNLGPSAKKAVEFVRDFFDDISRLLTTLDERMARESWLSIHGSQCYWGGSYSVKLGPQWLPHSVHRIYGKAPLRKGNAAVLSEAAFFSVYLIPKCSSQPLAVWGFAAQPQAADIYPRFDTLLYPIEGADFLESENQDSWKQVTNMKFDRFEFRSCPLVELTSAAVIDQKVVQPLMTQLKAVAPSRANP